MILAIRYTVALVVLAVLGLVAAQCIQDALGPYPVPAVPAVIIGGDSP